MQRSTTRTCFQCDQAIVGKQHFVSCKCGKCIHRKCLPHKYGAKEFTLLKRSNHWHCQGCPKRIQTWKNGILIFDIDEGIFNDGDKSVINAAMEELSALTSVRFQKRNHEVDFVRITRDHDRCSSELGKSGGVQNLNLGPGCISKRTVTHELMHALGVYHEHQRPCRDKYININYNNIPEDKWENFKKRAKEDEWPGIDYEYESIMHYKMNDFAIDPKIATIIPKQRGGIMGGDKLTKGDREKIERLCSG